MQIGLFQSANDEGKRLSLMFPDSQIAKDDKLSETKMKYKMHCILKDDLKNISYSFKFDETTTKQGKNQYEGYTQYLPEKHQCIKISYHNTLIVDIVPQKGYWSISLSSSEKNNWIYALSYTLVWMILM